MKIAFLGQGLMGAPMAMQCLKAGHEVTVYNRTAAKCEPMRAAGARIAGTPAEAARDQEAILICVEDTTDVEQVLFGEQGVIHGLRDQARPAQMVIDHSTISAEATEKFAGRIAREKGALYLDAPVSGGEPGARAGTLSIMCGGPAAAFERALPVLEAMGKTIIHIGERNGDGQRTKMINQMIVAIHLMATTEAIRLTERLGLNTERVMKAVTSGAAASWSLTNIGPRFIQRDFRPGFRLRHLLKDVSFCEETIAGLGSDPAKEYPAVALARQLIERSVDAGNGEENVNAMAKIFLDKS